jgi:hypothetical protein
MGIILLNTYIWVQFLKILCEFNYSIKTQRDYQYVSASNKKLVKFTTILNLLITLFEGYLFC